MRSRIASEMNRVLPLLACLVFACSFPAAAQEEIVCIQCHGAQTGRLGEPVKLWRKSIHAANGIACNDCHGGDPKDLVNAMSPARGFLGAPKNVDIPAFCGRCHVGVEKDYRLSAHGRALGKGGPTCVTCHSNHLVVKATLDIINEKTCTQCHTFERARIIRNAMSQTEFLIVSIDRKINAFKEEGVDTDRLEKGLFAIRNRFHTLFHEVDVEKVKAASAQICDELNKLDAELAKVAEQHQKRKLAGGVVVGVALLAALLFHFLRKTYD
jgi:Cytochrome c3